MNKEFSVFMKYIGILIFLFSFIGNYFVTQYKVNELVESVKNGQKILSVLVVEVEVLKTKIEHLKDLKTNL